MDSKMKQALMTATEDILKMTEEEFLQECEKFSQGDIAIFLKESGKFSSKCSTCSDTKGVENPLTGEMHFCPFCSDN